MLLMNGLTQNINKGNHMSLKEMIEDELEQKGWVTLIAEALTVLVLAPAVILGLLIFSEWIK